MTCIVGIKQDGKVYIGGDSAGVGGWDVTIRTDPKVFRVDDFVIGYSSSFRMGQVLRFGFHPYPPGDLSGDRLCEYMVTRFIDAVRERFKSAGYLTEKNGVQEGGHFLVGYKDRLFNIGSDFQVGESAKPYDSVGCGESYALGALHANEHRDLTADDRIKSALNAATEFSAGVRPPYIIMSTS